MQLAKNYASLVLYKINVSLLHILRPKKLYIKTYGCQMNFYDSVRMQDVLSPHGFETSEQVEDSDLVILNTCHIREKAAEKVYSELGRIR